MKELTHHAKFLKSISDRIAQYRETTKKIVESKDKINAIATIIDSAAAKFEEAGCGVNQWNGTGDVSLGFSVTGLSSFKDPAILELIESLMGEGLEFNNHDYAAAINRAFHGTMTTESGLQIKVAIRAYVKDDSVSCRRIVKSSKFVEQYEFEIVCD